MSLWELLSGLGNRPTAAAPDRSAALAGLVPDPDGASGYGDIAGNSREARAAAGLATAPMGALDYFGKTLRGAEPLYDPATGHPSDEAYSHAATLAGLGMTGGIGAPVRAAAGEQVLGAGPIRAYHGSPHDFDRFDLSKIGTGEGAQAYGHGLYFAENEGVARSYRDALTKPISGVRLDGGLIEQAGVSPAAQGLAKMHSEGFVTLAQSEARARQSLDKAKAELAANPNSQVASLNKEAADRTLAALDELRGREISYAPYPGRMYEVDIHADPERFLDWDKPLSAQSVPVRKALDQIGVGGSRAMQYGEMKRDYIDPMRAATAGTDIGRFVDPEHLLNETANMAAVRKHLADDPARLQQVNDLIDAYKRRSELRGGDAYHILARSSENEIGGLTGAPRTVEASEALNELGIPGLRYLDGGSRGVGEGSRNVVTFSDRMVEILRKYGLLGPVAGGAAASALAPQDAPQQQ